MYEERFYRRYCRAPFNIEVSYRESDLFISADKEIDKERAQSILQKYYDQIDSYTKKNPTFLNSLSPIDDDKSAPIIAREMIQSSRLTGIGPFSCIAGAIAKYVGQNLLRSAGEVIIENGGDLFLKINEDKKIGVYLGENFKIGAINLKIRKKDRPFGISSSSSAIGHSLNFGKADLVTVVASDAIIADGFATALSNRIKKKNDVDQILEEVKDIDKISGLVIAFDNNIFLWGDLEVI